MTCSSSPLQECATIYDLFFVVAAGIPHFSRQTTGPILPLLLLFGSFMPNVSSSHPPPSLHLLSFPLLDWHPTHSYLHMFTSGIIIDISEILVIKDSFVNGSFDFFRQRSDCMSLSASSTVQINLLGALFQDRWYRHRLNYRFLMTVDKTTSGKKQSTKESFS